MLSCAQGGFRKPTLSWWAPAEESYAVQISNAWAESRCNLPLYLEVLRHIGVTDTFRNVEHHCVTSGDKVTRYARVGEKGENTWVV